MSEFVWVAGGKERKCWKEMLYMKSVFAFYVYLKYNVFTLN